MHTLRLKLIEKYSNRGDQKVIRPNYRDFRRSKFILEHSAKGSEWEDHLYIKRVDGTYYYPDSYKGGRHLPDGDKAKEDENKDYGEDTKKMEDDVFEKIKAFTYDKPKEMLTESFDKVLKEQIGVDWTKIPKEEVNKMQSSLLQRLEKLGPAYNDKIKSNDKPKLSEKDYDNLANEVIRGNFGIGQQRKDLLGESYEVVQKRVNQIMKSSSVNAALVKKIPESGEQKSSYISAATKAAKRATSLVESYRKTKGM